MKKQGIPFDRKLLNVLLFLNFVFLFTVNPVENLSRLIILSSIALLCALLIRASITRTLHFPRLLLFYLAFWVYVCFSALWAPNLDLALHSLAIFTAALFCVAVFWLGLYYTDFRTVLSCAVVVVTVVQVYFLAIGDPIPEQEYRVGGLSDNPNDTAMELSMVAFLAMIFLRHWLLRYGLVVFGLVGSLPTGTRKIMFTVVGLAVMAFAQFTRYLTASRQRLIFFSAVALLACGMAALAAAPLLDKLAQTQTYVRIAELLEGRLDYSARDRWTLLNEAVDIWLRSPIFGNGIASVQALSSFHLYAHNNYIELLASFGLVGFLLFYAFDFAVIAKLLPRAWRGSELHRQLLIVMIAILVYDTSMVSYDTRSSTLLVRAIVAFLADRDSLDARQYND